MDKEQELKTLTEQYNDALGILTILLEKIKQIRTQIDKIKE